MFIDNDNNCISKCNKYFKRKHYTNQPEEEYYSCESNCENYISSNNECVEKCALGENFIGADRRCKTWCDLTDGLYYYKIDTNVCDGKNYNIYKCI